MVRLLNRGALQGIFCNNVYDLSLDVYMLLRYHLMRSGTGAWIGDDGLNDTCIYFRMEQDQPYQEKHAGKINQYTTGTLVWP